MKGGGEVGGVPKVALGAMVSVGVSVGKAVVVMVGVGVMVSVAGTVSVGVGVRVSVVVGVKVGVKVAGKGVRVMVGISVGTAVGTATVGGKLRCGPLLSGVVAKIIRTIRQEKTASPRKTKLM